MTLSWTLDHTGPMARTVEDCAFLLQAMAGHDPADPASSTVPVGDYLTSLRRGASGLTIGVPRNYFFEGVDAEIQRAFEEAMDTLRKLGAEVRDVRIPSLRGAMSFLLILMAEAYAYHERDLRERPELYGDVLRERLLAGALVSGSEYTQAQRIRAEICAETAEVLRDVDLLATPTTPKPATPFTLAHDPEFAFPRSNMAPFNLTGLPTLALPCGFSSTGLPLSMQLSGRPFEEGTVLRVGHAYEEATAWHTRRPPV
jgi:aspartyl-tRNA(Asn)/glutamyl-tRNA(Gln) amidotransferase subunit A